MVVNILENIIVIIIFLIRIVTFILGGISLSVNVVNLFLQ